VTRNKIDQNKEKAAKRIKIKIGQKERQNSKNSLNHDPSTIQEK